MQTIAIGYQRFSPRPDADETQSNEKQLECIRRYCEQRGYTLAQNYEDRDITGGDDSAEVDAAKVLQARPGLLAALDSLRRGMVLVVRWRSRLARSVYIQEYCHRRAQKAGSRIEASDEPNGDLPTDAFMRHVFAGLSEMQRLEARIRTGLAMRRHQNIEHRLQGRADRPPFGWRVNPDGPRNAAGRPCQLVEDESEQNTLTLLLMMHSLGKNSREICRLLDDDGFPRRGKTWRGAHTTVEAIIRRNSKP